jgi:pSer/pThr/pTyr-binding forkhead associated (FHA) protein
MAASGPNILRFRGGLPKKRQFGEHLRLLVSQGAEENVCFCLVGPKIIIGREEGCDIRLDDAKTSRQHADLTFVKNHYVLTDLGSANGVLVNNMRVTQVPIKPGDVIVVGLTIFEVYPPPAATMNAAAALIKEKEAEEKNKVGRSRILVFGLVLLAFYLAFAVSEEHVQTLRQKARVELVDEKVEKKKLTKKEAKDALREYMPIAASDEKNRKKDAENFYKIGVRELDNRNFRRAISAFETALTVDPTHELSKIYMKRAKKEFDEEIKQTFQAATEAERTLRFEKACRLFQDVMRFLEADTTHKNYVKAKESFERLQTEEKCPR